MLFYIISCYDIVLGLLAKMIADFEFAMEINEEHVPGRSGGRVRGRCAAGESRVRFWPKHETELRPAPYAREAMEGGAGLLS